MQLSWWSSLSGPGGFGATWADPYAPGNWYFNLDTDSEGMLRVEHRNRFILDFDLTNNKQIPFWQLQVRDDLVSGANVYCAAVPGEHYLIYFDSGSPGSTNLDLSNTTASLPVTWLNPDTGARTDGGMTPPGVSQTFSKPFGGPAVLYIGQGVTVGNNPPPPSMTVDKTANPTTIPATRSSMTCPDRG